MNQDEFETKIGTLTNWCRLRNGFSYETLQKKAIKIFGCSDIDRYFSSIRDYYLAKGSHHADKFEKYKSRANWFELKAWHVPDRSR